jgi:hypothetical protein
LKKLSAAQKTAIVLATVLVIGVAVGLLTRGSDHATAQGSQSPKAQEHLQQLEKLLDSGQSSQSSANFQQDLPDCIPVDTRSGVTAGCILKADYQMNPTQAAEFLKAHPEGLPVYAAAGSSQVVGYESDGFGFVPVDLATQIGTLKQCNDQLSARLHGQPNTPTLSTECTDLLAKQGVRQSDLAAAG